MTHGNKIVQREQLADLAKRWRAQGEKIVLTNGIFDLLHVGHVRYLRGAKELGGKVVVAVNSDSSARALKGEGRPHTPQQERAEVLAALHLADALLISPHTHLTATIREPRPDSHAKDTDHTADTVP